MFLWCFVHILLACTEYLCKYYKHFVIIKLHPYVFFHIYFEYPNIFNSARNMYQGNRKANPKVNKLLIVCNINIIQHRHTPNRFQHTYFICSLEYTVYVSYRMNARRIGYFITQPPLRYGNCCSTTIQNVLLKRLCY